MKKLITAFLLLLFAITLIFSISNELKSDQSNTQETFGYASIIPIPPPEPPARRGC